MEPWNTFVEGDNLDVLERLASSGRRYDVVYLDPPYNTGNPFAYQDKMVGRRVDRHRAWAAMMRPRLEAVREVMTERGAVFVSIDDHEVAHLRLLMDEVFGEDGFVAQIVVNLNAKGRQLGSGFATSHEYLLVYARSIASCALDPSSPSIVDPADFPLTDADGHRYRRLPLRNTNKKFNPITAPTMHFAIFGSPETGRVSAEPFAGSLEIKPVFGDGAPAVWRWSATRITERPDDLVCRWVGGATGRRADVFQKDWLHEGRRKKLRTIWLASEIGSTDTAVAELKALVGHLFESPKPTGLLRRILETMPARRPRAGPLRGQRYDGPRPRAPERRGRWSAYLPLRQLTRADPAGLQRATWPAMRGSATSPAPGCSPWPTWSAAATSSSTPRPSGTRPSRTRPASPRSRIRRTRCARASSRWSRHDGRMTTRVALVTGGSSGIGEKTALRLQAEGFTTYAVARRVDRMEALASAGVTTFAMDVTDDASMVAGVERIIGEHGRIDVLVNNAGYGSYGAVEDVPIDEARRQFEVNVFGLARLTQLVTPHLRAQGSGRIVNISSIGGKFYEPLGAWYHATKFAVEGFSDSLRVELAPYGIHVVMVEPGPILTEWNTIARESLVETSRGGAYEERAEAVRRRLEKADGRMTASSPDVVAKKIVKAATAAHPRARYPVGKGAGTILGARRVLPDRAFDAIVQRLYS